MTLTVLYYGGGGGGGVICARKDVLYENFSSSVFACARKSESEGRELLNRDRRDIRLRGAEGRRRSRVGEQFLHSEQQ